MSYLLGWKALRAFVGAGDSLAYFRAKLSPALFKGEEERKVFELVDQHFHQYRVLPKLETVVGNVPAFAEIEAPEVPQYYVDLLERRYEYDTMDRLTTSIQQTLKANKNDTESARQLLSDVIHEMNRQKYRRQVLDMGVEGGQLLMTAYGAKLLNQDRLAIFGWDYMDSMTNGVGAGEVVSYVGRPAAGKTWLMVNGANKNWVHQKSNVLLVSMEMNTLQIAQREIAIYSKVGVKGIKEAQLSTPMFKRFQQQLKAMESETGKLYILDGNLMANIEEIYSLAYQLECSAVYIDGAYLVKAMNPKLGRYDRVAENVEYMKKASGEIGLATFASWQFNREAAKKEQKKGQKAGVEDIGYSDAIGQVSSIVVGMMQEDGVETINRRRLTVMKGRNGEIGSFEINWLFDVMNFEQVEEQKAENKLEYV